MPAAHGLTDRAQGQGGAAGDLRRQGVGFGAQRIGGNQTIAQPDAQGFLPRQSPPGVQQVARPLLTDDGGKGDRQAEDVVEAEPDEVRREPGLRTANPEVGGTRQPQAGTDGCTLDRGHHGGLRIEEPRGLSKHHLGTLGRLRRGPRSPGLPERLAPAQKCLPSEHNRIARQPGSVSRAAYASANDRITSVSK